MTAIANRHWGMSVGMALAVHGVVIAMLPSMNVKPLPPPMSSSVIVELASHRGGSPKAEGGGGHVETTPVAPRVVPKPEAKPVPAVTRPVVRQAAMPAPPPPLPASQESTHAAAPDTPADAGTGIGNGPGHGSGAGVGNGVGDGTASGRGDHGGGVFTVDAAVLSHKANAAYVQTLFNWLEQYRQYPRRARLTNTEGTVLLRFRIDRQGNLLAWNVVRGSGSAMLDKAVEDMITAANPLPPVPSDFAGASGAQSLEFVLPIEFRLLS